MVFDPQLCSAFIIVRRRMKLDDAIAICIFFQPRDRRHSLECLRRKHGSRTAQNGRRDRTNNQDLAHYNRTLELFAGAVLLATQKNCQKVILERLLIYLLGVFILALRSALV